MEACFCFVVVETSSNLRSGTLLLLLLQWEHNSKRKRDGKTGNETFKHVHGLPSLIRPLTNLHVAAEVTKKESMVDASEKKKNNNNNKITTHRPIQWWNSSTTFDLRWLDWASVVAPFAEDLCINDWASVAAPFAEDLCINDWPSVGGRWSCEKKKNPVNKNQGWEPKSQQLRWSCSRWQGSRERKKRWQWW